MLVYLWLLFGISAFAFVLFALVHHSKKQSCMLFMLLSLVSGMLSLISAFAVIYRYIQRSDLSAVMDVIPALFWICTVLSFLWIVLNILLFASYYKK